MIVNTELKIAFITPPRTGSTFLIQLFKGLPGTVFCGRHREADYLPPEYSQFQKLGFVRHPVERLWSLYCYIRGSRERFDKFSPWWVSGVVGEAQKNFNDWLATGDFPFASDRDPASYYWTGHTMAEQRKSQFIYLRPDLGTKILRFENFEKELTKLGFGKGVSLTEKVNSAKKAAMPKITEAAAVRLMVYHAWEWSIGYDLLPYLDDQAKTVVKRLQAGAKKDLEALAK